MGMGPPQIYSIAMDEVHYEEEEGGGYINDVVAFSLFADGLRKVAKAPNMVNQEDRNQYEEIVNILDPLSGSDEALFVTTLQALKVAISRIDVAYHASLLRNIFSISLWNYRFPTRQVILELIINLAAVPDKYLDGCLHMLVTNFMPPRRIRESINQPRFADKRNIHRELYVALHHITDLVPLAPLVLREVIERRMPRITDPKEVINVYVKCMLELENDEIGELLGSTLLTKVVELLVDLDVNIPWEDILQEEDHNKNIFDIELVDVDDNANAISTKSEETERIFKGNALADKLDSLMVIVCEYLDSCASNGYLVKVFETLAESFRRTVMNAYKLKFVQFVMFYACSLDPEICGLKFAVMLTDIFVSNSEGLISRMSSIAYLASYLSRAKFIPTSLVASILNRLVDWCSDYCKIPNGREIKDHRLFYSGCQAVMYILCFRMRSLMDSHLTIPLLKLEPILRSSLDPLKACLPTIVHEFLRQAKSANLFKVSSPFLDDNLLESEFSKAFGGMERLDMFFPFDPYLLKESDRFIEPNFNFWYMVKTTYSNYNSEDEDEPLDAPQFDDHDNISENNDDQDDDDDLEIELYMDQMAITPK